MLVFLAQRRARGRHGNDRRSQRVRRASGEQQHGQAVAKQVLDRHAGIRRAGIDMNQHRLAARMGADLIARSIVPLFNREWSGR